MNLLLHPHTRKRLEGLSKNLSHANILIGEHGLGKRTAILEMIKQLEPQHSAAIEHGTFEHLIVLTTDQKSVGIEAIKDLESLLNLTEVQQRYVIIPSAEQLTHEAQNAFLKTFEETPQRVTTFLLVEHANQLLPTIKSRAQILNFTKPTQAAFVDWMEKEHNLETPQATQMYYLTQGRPGLVTTLLSDSEQHDVHQSAMQTAKLLFTQTISQRLATLKSLEKDTESLQRLLQNLQTISRAALTQAAYQDNHAKAKQWAQKLELCLQLSKYLQKNANPRLITDKLVLNL